VYRKEVLDNGLRIVTETVPHVRSVSIAIFVGAGSRYESEDKAGVFHFVEHLCFKGTSRRPTAREISEAIEGVGGALNEGTGKEMTTYWCKVTPPHFALAMDVLADVIRHPRFDPVDIETERQVIIEEINAGWDSPQYRADMLIDELLWPNQALGRNGAGDKESVAALTRVDLVNSLAQQYLPNNTVVSVAGNISHEEVVGRARDAFADWQPGSSLPWYPVSDSQETPRLCVEPRNIEQVHVYLGVKGLPIYHPDRFALGILSTILGGSMSSRLFTEIREKRGLAYSVYSSVDHFLDSGSFIVYAGVAPRHLSIAIEAILEELSRLKDGVTHSELSKTKLLSKGRLFLRMEDTYSMAGWLGGQELLQGKILTVDEVNSLIDAIQPDTLQRLAQQLLTTEKLSLAIVGPADGKGLEKLLQL